MKSPDSAGPKQKGPSVSCSAGSSRSISTFTSKHRGTHSRRDSGLNLHRERGEQLKDSSVCVYHRIELMAFSGISQPCVERSHSNEALRSEVYVSTATGAQSNNAATVTARHGKQRHVFESKVVLVEVRATPAAGRPAPLLSGWHCQRLPA